jgi:hypothetical protein
MPKRNPPVSEIINAFWSCTSKQRRIPSSLKLPFFIEAVTATDNEATYVYSEKPLLKFYRSKSTVEILLKPNEPIWIDGWLLRINRLLKNECFVLERRSHRMFVLRDDKTGRSRLCAGTVKINLSTRKVSSSTPFNQPTVAQRLRRLYLEADAALKKQNYVIMQGIGNKTLVCFQKSGNITTRKYFLIILKGEKLSVLEGNAHILDLFAATKKQGLAKLLLNGLVPDRLNLFIAHMHQTGINPGKLPAPFSTVLAMQRLLRA